jgi:hypothetical protein
VQHDIMIFWNHIGREHGGVEYVKDLKKNPQEVKEATLQLLENKCVQSDEKNQFIKHDDNILVELPPEGSPENFIIIYCLKEGLQYSLFHKKKHPWWLIDVIDVEEIKPNLFCIHDLLIDISIEESGKYKLLDMDEFEFAYRHNILSEEQVLKSLTSLNKALDLLNKDLFPTSLLSELVSKYMKAVE